MRDDQNLERTLFLETAFEIGANLSRNAIWDGSRCNWITPVLVSNSGEPGEVTSACGADYYSGTSGIAFFLASLYSVGGEEVFRIAALGALRHALSRQSTLSDRTPLSFY